MRERPLDDPSGEPARSRSYTVTSNPSWASARAALRPMTPAPTTAARSGSRRHHSAQLARLGELGHDVAAAHELAVDEELRDRRPARLGRELLADPGIRQDVDGRELGSRLVQGLDRPGREAAAREVGRALHEEHHPVLRDGLLDLLANLVVRDDHGASVLICNAWIVPSSSRCWTGA